MHKSRSFPSEPYESASPPNMDPASILAIISACSGITRNAAAFITGLNSFVDRLKNVELDLGSLDAQTGILSLASERLRLWIIAHDTELNEEERKSLWKCTDHCEQLLRALRTVTEKAKKVSKAEDAEGRSHKAGRIGFWKKLGTVFAQPKLDRYINDLERQTHALATFLQIFER